MTARLPIEERPFPIHVSQLAEFESWRRERHRPATYTHKWWARRLGTVVQACLLGCTDKPGPQPLAGAIVLDPFAGSGTTLVEARKLGARIIGRDINPVATLTQRQALQMWDAAKLLEMHEQVRAACQKDIDALYVTADGRVVLQYFWVAQASCTTCSEEVDLFSSRIFAKHAYPSQFPRAQSSCPHCSDVVEVTAQTKRTRCSSCDRVYLTKGPVTGRAFRCSKRHESNLIAALAGEAPSRRLYAKLVLDGDGTRTYEAVDDFDRDLYDKAGKLLANSAADELVLPTGQLEQGTNTRQAVNWGYRTWSSFFNERQLFSLARIAAALSTLEASPEREALIAAFGRTLEHHNLFCSYKGEGTGPVRSIFHNHVLRPERCNVEGNPWGSNGGSGGFGDALHRLLESLAYKHTPTDLEQTVAGTITTVDLGRIPLESPIVTDWNAFAVSTDAAYVTTGDAAATDIPDRSVDIVATDPPYLDNVHYSELADFFDAWMTQLRPYPQYPTEPGTRSESELQNTDANVFETMSVRAWTECHRVLKDDGVLIFSFHQSKPEGWRAVMRSLATAGFVVTATRPVVAEVSSSLTKGAAALPNRIDVIVVARKIRADKRQLAAETVKDLRSLHKHMGLGEGDVLSAMRAAVFAEGTHGIVDWDELTTRAETVAAKTVTHVLTGKPKVAAK